MMASMSHPAVVRVDTSKHAPFNYPENRTTGWFPGSCESIHLRGSPQFTRIRIHPKFNIGQQESLQGVKTAHYPQGQKWPRGFFCVESIH